MSLAPDGQMLRSIVTIRTADGDPIVKPTGLGRSASGGSGGDDGSDDAFDGDLVGLMATETHDMAPCDSI